jgi:hypothetical protein
MSITSRTSSAATTPRHSESRAPAGDHPQFTDKISKADVPLSFTGGLKFFYFSEGIGATEEKEISVKIIDNYGVVCDYYLNFYIKIIR